MILSCPDHKKYCWDNAKLYAFGKRHLAVILLMPVDIPVGLVSQKYEAYVYCPLPHQSQNPNCFPLASSFFLCNEEELFLSSQTSEEHKCISFCGHFTLRTPAVGLRDLFLFKTEEMC